MSVTRSMLVEEALKYKEYSSVRHANYGACEMQGFCCSCFVTFLLRGLGILSLQDSRLTSSEYFDLFGVPIHEEMRTLGDLVFFSWTGIKPDHIGILISPEEYIHAPGKDNSHIGISSLDWKRIPQEKIEAALMRHPNAEKIYSRNPIGFKRVAVRRGKYQQLLPL